MAENTMKRDSVASRDAFENMCRRYFFHRRASIIADISRHEERTRQFVVPLPVRPLETNVNLYVYQHDGVYNAWFRFGERAWNIGLHSPSPPPVPPCVPTHLFISRSERRRNSKELSLSASGKRVLFSLYTRPLYRWLSLLRYPFPGYRNAEPAKKRPLASRLIVSFRVVRINCARIVCEEFSSDNE